MTKQEIADLIKQCNWRLRIFVAGKDWFKADQIKHKIKLLKRKLRE